MKEINLHGKRVVELLERYHVRTLKMFGSTARNEANENSDVDLLVTFSEPVSLLRMVSLERELSLLLRRKVDLVTEHSVSQYLRKQILKESRLVYAA
jgi:predicted nucleotidyltransferase